ncbi:methyl-accepting chemotaxis protein [Pseudomonas sp. S75]|nr:MULTISPECIES: methyl-accepting chemotaxis protein [unclassified Pseudomonas]MBJ9978370.1 methyl-accepting chemotaxis protein [Pseudomonas sp. S30]MBK0156325.1 methyl-accepting chemotaxis protein [Pseudomonas sp. S75]
MFGKIGITKRLAFGFALVVGLMLIVTAIGVQRVRGIDSVLTQVSSQTTVKQRYAINLRGSVHDRAIAIRDAVLTHDESQLAPVLQDIQRLDAFYQTSAAPLAKMLGDPQAAADEQRLQQQIQAAERAAQAATAQLLELRHQGDFEHAQALLLAQVAPAYKEWLRSINAFIDFQEKNVVHDIAAVRESASGFAGLMLWAAALAALVSVVASLLIIRSIRSTLGAEPEEVAQLLRGLAEGRIAANLRSEHPRSVMGALGTTNRHLTDIVAQVNQVAADLVASSTRMSQNAVANQGRMQQQSDDTQQMASAVTQLVTAINQISAYAASAASASAAADQGVDAGKTVVEGTASSMQALAEVLESASEAVLQVASDSQAIEGIIEVINAIAERTNLLALNAAIEAARAGEFGRGFAVVADEVRSLANRTQESTREISGMIAKLQTGAGKTAQIVGSSRELAQETVERTQVAQRSLNEIRREVAAISQMNNQIATASLQQDAAANLLGQDIQRIQGASQEVQAGSTRLAHDSRELLELADALGSRMGFFKTAG